jgi:hypothetical protein
MLRAVFVVFAWLLLSAQTIPPGFPPGTFQNRAALDAGSAAPPSIARTGGATSGTVASNTITFASVPIAAGLVVIVTQGLDTLINPITGIALDSGGGPVAMSAVVDTSAGGSAEAAIYQLVVGSGTTASVAVTYTGTPAASSSIVDAYSITGLSSNTATGTLAVNGGAGSVSTLNGSLVSSAGGVAVIAATQRGGNSSTLSLTGVANTNDRNCFGIAGFSCTSNAHASSLTATTNTITATWNGSEHSVLVGAAWQ